MYIIIILYLQVFEFVQVWWVCWCVAHRQLLLTIANYCVLTIANYC